MKARIYRGTRLIAEADVSIVHHDMSANAKAAIALSDRITVAFVDDHPHLGARPLFVHGIVEGA